MSKVQYNTEVPVQWPVQSAVKIFNPTINLTQYIKDLEELCMYVKHIDLY